MKNYLSRKGFSFDFYVIEQEDGKPFNRGKLLNIGFHISSQKDSYKNFCFHDVDLIPVNVDYSFADDPTHLSSEVEQLGWKYPPVINGFEYPDIFGGIILFTENKFREINGYSNDYWGWGAEDDDILIRIRRKGIKESRRIPGVTRSLKHGKNLDQMDYRKNIEKLIKMRSAELDFAQEGLNTLNYETTETNNQEYYTKYTVKI
jgi:hypothetical protein